MLRIRLFGLFFVFLVYLFNCDVLRCAVLCCAVLCCVVLCCVTLFIFSACFNVILLSVSIVFSLL